MISGIGSNARSAGRATVDGGVRDRAVSGLPVYDRRAAFAGIRTAFLEGGEGRPIVLLHGQGEFGALWRRVIPELTRTHRVVVPDLPGHGESVLEGRLDADRVLVWLRELIDETCDAPPVLAGHLMGGAIAARFAVAHPDRVRQLVLVDSLGLGWFRPSARFALAMLGYMARPTERTQDRLFRYCMRDLDGVREDMGGRMDDLEEYALDRARTPALRRALRMLMPRVGVPPIRAADLSGIPVPTALIWGRDGLQVDVSIAERASARYGWPLHVIDGARDDPAVERPDAFMAALRAILADGEEAGAAPNVRGTSSAVDPGRSSFRREQPR